MILAVMVVNNFGRGRLLKFYSQRTAEQTLHGQEPCQHEQHGCRDGLSGDPEDSHLAGETLAGRGDNPRIRNVTR